MIHADGVYATIHVYTLLKPLCDAPTVHHIYSYAFDGCVTIDRLLALKHSVLYREDSSF